jgi:hypothetical protein
MVRVGKAGGGGLDGTLQITQIFGNRVTLLNPAPESIPFLPFADQNNNGIVRRLSGNAGDFLGADNACHPLPAALDASRPWYGVATGAGGTLVFDAGPDFALLVGATVHFIYLNSASAAAPFTLDVNGTGAKPLVNRSGAALKTYSLRGSPSQTIAIAPMHTAVYDGTNWRLTSFTWLYYYGSSGADETIDCTGFDGVDVQIRTAKAADQNFIFTNVSYGTLIRLRQIPNADPLGPRYAITVNGVAAWGLIAPTSSGATRVNLGAMTNGGYYVTMQGVYDAGGMFFRM